MTAPLSPQLKPRRNFEVKVHSKAELGDSEMVINHTGQPGVLKFILSSIASPDEAVATCESAKRLSDYAFDSGAQSVRHAYDLRLSDSEM